MMKILHSMMEKKIGENDEDKITDVIENFKQGKCVPIGKENLLKNNLMKEIKCIWFMTRNLIKQIRQEKDNQMKQIYKNKKLMKETRQKIQQY